MVLYDFPGSAIDEIMRRIRLECPPGKRFLPALARISQGQKGGKSFREETPRARAPMGFRRDRVEKYS
jgi:hypothetical protein